jgi:hypothetical protein
MRQANLQLLRDEREPERWKDRLGRHGEWP